MSKRSLALAVALLLGLGLGAIVGLRILNDAKAKSTTSVSKTTNKNTKPITVDVPRAQEAIVVDAKLEDAAWMRAGRSGGFMHNQALARPYSDARFAWRDGMLFVTLYAADEDIRFAAAAKHDDPLWTADAFSMAFTVLDRGGKSVQRTIDVSANGVLSDGTILKSGQFDSVWESGAKVAVHREGTANDPSDHDEEWVLEIAIPLSALGLTGRAGEQVHASVRRCDVIAADGVDADAKKKKKTRRVCAQWPEQEKALLLLVE